MRVRVVHLGHDEQAVISEVRDGGRTLVVGSRTFSLRPLTGEFVAVGEPYYGVRLDLRSSR
jgi:hypothetical protein